MGRRGFPKQWEQLAHRKERSLPPLQRSPGRSSPTTPVSDGRPAVSDEGQAQHKPVELIVSRRQMWPRQVRSVSRIRASTRPAGSRGKDPPVYSEGGCVRRSSPDTTLPQSGLRHTIRRSCLPHGRVWCVSKAGEPHFSHSMAPSRRSRPRRAGSVRINTSATAARKTSFGGLPPAHQSKGRAESGAARHA